MRQNNITSVADFLNTDRAVVERLFGLHGLRVYSELKEVPTYGMFEEGELQHSIMNSRSLKDATKDLNILADALSYHVANSAAKLRELNAATQVVRVILRPSRHGDWSLRGGSKEVMLGTPTSDTTVILHEALKLLGELYEREVPYKKVGIILSMISNADFVQSSLFAREAGAAKTSAVMSVVDYLNAKLGKNKVTIGRVENSTSWKASHEFVSPQYTTKWSDIRTIKV
jgi:DNA polymerase V